MQLNTTPNPLSILGESIDFSKSLIYFIATDILPNPNNRMRMRLLLASLLATALLLQTTSSIAGELSNQLTPEQKAAGWQLLFDGTSTNGWRSFKKQSFPANAWVIEHGWLHCLGKAPGDIISTGEYDDFELEWEWKLEPGGNSGVKYFVLESRNSALGHEYQMLDDTANPDGKIADGKHLTASFYDVLKPSLPLPSKPIGDINQSRISVKAGHVEHWLNGLKVLDYHCGSEAVKEAVAKSKFKNTAGFGNCVKGHILLQNHESQVWFRNIKIRTH